MWQSVKDQIKNYSFVRHCACCLQPHYNSGKPIQIDQIELPKAEVVDDVGPLGEGFSMQKREAEVEGWGSSWDGSKGAFVSIKGSTERGISEARKGERLQAGLSISGAWHKTEEDKKKLKI